MAKEAPANKLAAAPETKTEIPTDRPMGGILTRDDGRRTEHGIHPLDPSYSGTPIAQNEGIEQARQARVDAGLEADPNSAAPAEGEAEKSGE